MTKNNNKINMLKEILGGIACIKAGLTNNSFRYLADTTVQDERACFFIFIP